ncbi:hypothetical protein FHU29_004489 [Hoyosella altamirensis]|uniref:Uncharacterized protein n=1 Tax=Hoyosella altamirensis TaxID=616997 RepID=A0A839RUG9_9ACTN|nr:hypothetical protein [Hoyosella altamirensis]MBB3039427.1 hypothetical protein [Hoyosella altamirensis]MBB3039999.1 hypothetical protein [Hoyosella altamirensis]
MKQCRDEAERLGDTGVIRAGRYLGNDRKRGKPMLKNDGDPCLDCEVPTRSRHMVYEKGLELPEGWAIRHAKGLCRACYEARRGAGTLPESEKLQDGDPCFGCGRPTRSARRSWQEGMPEGWVRRENGSMCARCYNASRQAKKAGVAA